MVAAMTKTILKSVIMMEVTAALIPNICTAKSVNAKNLINVQELIGLVMEIVMMKTMWLLVILMEMIVVLTKNINIAMNADASYHRTYKKKFQSLHFHF